MNKHLFAVLAASAGWLASPSWAGTPLDLHMSTGYTPKSGKDLHVNFQEPTFSGEKFHQYLGLTTLGLVALTALSPKKEDGPHELFATAAAVTAGATVANGLIFHWEDFNFDDGFSDPDNLHMMLGTLGAMLMVAAVAQAPEGGHAGLGIGGGAAMAMAVKITW